MSKVICLLSIIAFLVLSGCATPKYNYRAHSIELSEPPIGSINTVYVGDIMLRQGNYTEHDSIYVKENIKVSWAYTLLPGYFLKHGDDKISEFYRPGNGNQAGYIDKAALADPWQSVQVYKDDSKICVVTVFNGASCGKSNQYERQKKPILTKNSFQQTLIYSGKIGNKINIGYREFSKNHARPAFNNDVEYDLSESNMIGYKGAKLEIIEATNEYIKFRVIRNFNKAVM